MPISIDFAQKLLPRLDEIVQRFGTPFHVYDAWGIVQAHRALVDAFEESTFRQYFAVKALPNPAVLSLLHRVGSGLDCSSPVELQLARLVGAKGESIIFTSNNTTREEYELALSMGARITLDDRTFMRAVERLPDLLAFRVSPQGYQGGSGLMGDAAGSKFGVPRAELVATYKEAQARGVRRFGFHGMMCANELDLDRAVQAAVVVIRLASEVSQSTGIHFEYINIGGGLGIPYRPDNHPVNLVAYARAIRDTRDHYFSSRPPCLVMECGRCITGPHGVLVSRVISRCRKGRDVVGVDASMSALMRPGIYGAYHHISLPFATGRDEVECDVVGSLCENFDKFGSSRHLPDPRVGDLLMVHDTGAHGHAMGFNYNGRLRPAELLLMENGEVRLIRRAETFDDYVATIQWAGLPTGKEV